MKVRKWLAVLLTLLIIGSVTGCGAEEKNAASRTDAAVSMGEMENVSDSSGGKGGETTLPQGRKWIVTIDLDAETDDLDSLLSGLNQKIADLSGYVESQYIHNGTTRYQQNYRRANMTIRIPANRADDFVGHVDGVSNVISNNKQMEDVTLTYVSTESRMKALQAEETRLLELMAQAQTMKDLLEIESRLTDVRYNLERITSQLRVYDNLVDYATINLSVSEVKKFTPTEERTAWQRIGDGFVDSLRNVGNGTVEFVIWIVVNLPYLVIWGVLGTGVFLIVRRRMRKKTQSRDENTDKTE